MKITNAEKFLLTLMLCGCLTTASVARAGEYDINPLAENKEQNYTEHQMNSATDTSYTDCTFTDITNDGSSDDGKGGAIYNYDYRTITTISGCTFTGNTALSGSGGAIYNGVNATITTISGCEFSNNTAISSSTSAATGGAISNSGTSSTITTISGCTFSKNTANGYGGAISNSGTSSTITTISGCTFEGNTAGYEGGAICNSNNINTISDCTFTSNTASSGDGGAIFNDSETNTGLGAISGCTFTGNTADSNGGAIYNKGTLGTIKNTSFYGNTAGGNGGAIYSTEDLTIAADGSATDGSGDVVFSGNKANSKSNAIYMDSSSGKISFELSNGGSIRMEDSIDGASGYSVEISGDDAATTTFYLLSDINNASSISVGKTTFSTMNGEFHDYSGYSFTLTGDINLEFDVDLANSKAELTADNFITGEYSLTVTGINASSDASRKDEYVAVYFAEEDLMKSVSLGISEDLSDNTYQVYTPKYTYNVYYVYKDDEGVHYGDDGLYDVSESSVFSADDATGGYFVFRNLDYNPSVYSASVAQAGAFGAMNLMFNYSFEHSDYFMKLPSDVRNAQREKSKSKVKRFENDPTRPAYYNRHMLTQRGAWIRPFVANDLVAYRGNFQSRDKYYGALIGFDSDLREHRGGWASVFTGFTGYEGISQSFDGGNIKQRGGVIGVTESAYKKNFYTAVTAALSTTKAEGRTMWGKEDTRFNTFGVAAKAGYNFELGDGSVSLLPTFTASYARVGMNTYTSSGGIRMSSEGVYAFQLNPNLKFIVNRKDGLQPYFTVGEIWTVGQTSDVRADGDKLDELELRPYLEYGFGVQKRWENSLDAYAQILGHAGSREGVVLNAGLRWNF